MSLSRIFGKVADTIQKGIVIGLVSFTGFQFYQIVKNASEGRVETIYKKSTYFKDVEEKVKEEYQKDNLIDHRDWYQAEDDSYLKNQVRADITDPKFKQKFEQKQSKST